VGLANGAAAHVLLQTHQVPVLSECLFGVGHRQIIFDVSNGNVWVRRVKPTDARPLPLKKTR
jgi:chemotaxis protein CheD